MHLLCSASHLQTSSVVGDVVNFCSAGPTSGDCQTQRYSRHWSPAQVGAFIHTETKEPVYTINDKIGDEILLLYFVYLLNANDYVLCNKFIVTELSNYLHETEERTLNEAIG